MTDQTTRDRAAQVIGDAHAAWCKDDYPRELYAEDAILDALDAAGIALRDSDQTAEEVAAHILELDDRITELETDLTNCANLENICSGQIATVMAESEAKDDLIRSYRAALDAAGVMKR
jgi:hypothetical protein